MILIKWKGCSLSFRAMGVCQICTNVLDSELVSDNFFRLLQKKGKHRYNAHAVLYEWTSTTKFAFP